MCLRFFCGIGIGIGIEAMAMGQAVFRTVGHCRAGLCSRGHFQRLPWFWFWYRLLRLRLQLQRRLPGQHGQRLHLLIRKTPRLRVQHRQRAQPGAAAVQQCHGRQGADAGRALHPVVLAQLRVLQRVGHHQRQVLRRALWRGRNAQPQGLVQGRGGQGIGGVHADVLGARQRPAGQGLEAFKVGR